MIDVQALAHFLAGLEKRHGFLIDVHMGTCARVAPETRIPPLDRKGAEATQFDPITPRQRIGDLIQDGVDDSLYVPLIKMRILFSDTLDEFRLNHLDAPDPIRLRHD
jgi:hypothetical protein